MSCTSPLKAVRLESGEVKIVGTWLRSARENVAERLELPCGKCVDCRGRRASDWKARLMHEWKCHDAAQFVTLTYAPEHLPASGGLEYRDVQLFLKRVRSALKREGRPSFRFFVAGEYGSETRRPHWHLIAFGLDLPDLEPPGAKNASSAWLSALWGLGHVSVGPFDEPALAYVTKYALKQYRSRDGSDGRREWVDADTGEICRTRPEFAKMSLRPGIGGVWFDKFGATDYAPRGSLVLASRKPAGRGRYRLEAVDVGPIRYYDKRLEQADPDQMEVVKLDRMVARRMRPAETDDDRARRAAYGEAMAKRVQTKL